MTVTREPTHAVAVAAHAAVMPSHCACCDAVAAQALAEHRARDGATVFVPYCTACHRHSSAVQTRRLVFVLATSVLGLTSAAALPLLWPFLPAVAYGCLVIFVAWLPWVALPIGWRRRPRAAHTAVGRAAWWLESGELCLTNSRFATELALANAGSVRIVREREPRWTAWMAAGWALVLVLAPLLYWVHRPLVRVVNLTGARLVVYVDRHRLVEVEPTSVENARAGVEVRIPSGQREFLAEGPGGQVVARALVQVRGAREHLYAPGSEDYCFWLETTSYGRVAPPTPRIEPLTGPDRFWALSGRVDTWFDQNPEPPVGDPRTSGGSLVALRQARCADAPDSVVRAAGQQSDERYTLSSSVPKR
jgi:hypothetical protein